MNLANIWDFKHSKKRDESIRKDRQILWSFFECFGVKLETKYLLFMKNLDIKTVIHLVKL